MASVDEQWQELFQGLERLKGKWPAPDWSYDRRLRCVASSIPMSLEPAARAAMTEVLPKSWSAQTLAEAPEGVRKLAESCGGVRSAQLLFWGGEPGTPGAFGLWWPWGDGTTVSLRIGLHDLDQPKERYPKLRDIFGIPQATAAAPG
ncbi:MAG TPA: hypothetical protein VG319_01700 [Polyangia bacterium]|jgi:hypothetical protein|nr:hypothetical protein [Polyangia bacterium]